VKELNGKEVGFIGAVMNTKSKSQSELAIELASETFPRSLLDPVAYTDGCDSSARSVTSATLSAVKSDWMEVEIVYLYNKRCRQCTVHS
jgi:hypothetical protein